MREARFCRYELRTIDIPAAQRFYRPLLGDRPLDIVPLPEQARARGAVPHWLGHLGVDDVEPTASAFVERGATRLGPTRSTADGELAILRDPGGAVVALATPSPAPPIDVVWHALNTDDLARTIAAYRDVFGWTVDLGDLGVLKRFAWRPDTPSVGWIAAIGGRPGVHPHWLFHFPVPALELAVAHVRAAGGLVAGVFELPDGDRIAVCDDPQGAAFALHQRAEHVPKDT